jgi:NTP pyrophosphatase (non-canonical NTP hydrolase)
MTKLLAHNRIPAADRVKLATRTEAPVTPEMIERFSNPETIRIAHYIFGLVTEAGEALDQLKKHLYYGKPLDKVNLKEELGDTDWYMNLACSVFDTTMQEIEEANIKKLYARYGEKFSADAALIRNLDNERKVLEDNLNG